MARDIFTVNLFGHTPSLADLLVALDRDVASGLLGRKIEKDVDLNAAIAELDGDEATRIYRLADLIHSAAQLEPDEIDAFAKDAGLRPKKADSPISKLYAVLERSGEAALETIVATTVVSAVGKFSDYSGKRVDLANVKLAEFAAQLEQSLESQLSNRAGDTRRVKVRPRLVPEVAPKRLLCGVYYERSDSHGREIRTGKQLVLTTFKRPVGATYFWIRRSRGGGARITIRGCDIATPIRECVAQTLWNDTAGFRSDPITAYDLNPFKNPQFTLRVAPAFASDLADVSLARITVSTLNNNRIVVRTLTKTQNALEDFHTLARGAPVLIQGSTIDDVEVRFRLASDKRRTIKATLTPTSIQLDEAHMDLVQAHLEQWGITSD